MDHIAPAGPVYQAGTLSGNPIAMTAGIKTLELLSAPNFHKELGEKSEALLTGLKASADKHGIPLCTASAGGMFGFFFTAEKLVSSFDQVMACNTDHFNKFFHAMLEAGVYLAPSSFEAGFISHAHTDDDIAATVAAADKAFASLG